LLGLLLNRKQDVKYVENLGQGQTGAGRLELLIALYLQARPLQSCARRSRSDTQGAVGEGLGKPKSPLRLRHVCFHDASATGMCKIHGLGTLWACICPEPIADLARLAHSTAHPGAVDAFIIGRS
jgi:hypothetical protein